MSSVQRQSSGFILMPFATAFRDVYNAIRLAISDADLTPKRADDEFLTRASLERILRGILEAEVVIADMTGRNPNVFYEVGIAHATKENVVLLAQSIKDDVPFDVQHIDHLEYVATREGLKRLRSQLTAIIKGLPPEPQVLTKPTFEGGLRVRDGVEEHELHRLRDAEGMYLAIHLLVTNTGTKSLTLTAPSIEFDDSVVEAHYRFLRVETGSGRKSIPMRSRKNCGCVGQLHRHNEQDIARRRRTLRRTVCSGSSAGSRADSISVQSYMSTKRMKDHLHKALRLTDFTGRLSVGPTSRLLKNLSRTLV
jgi:hypothetical protein